MSGAPRQGSSVPQPDERPEPATPATPSAGPSGQPDPAPAGSPFAMLGRDDAAVCVDGVCELPSDD